MCSDCSFVSSAGNPNLHMPDLMGGASGSSAWEVQWFAMVLARNLTA